MKRICYLLSLAILLAVSTALFSGCEIVNEIKNSISQGKENEPKAPPSFVGLKINAKKVSEHYARAGQEVYLGVMISNPDEVKINSVTINGVEYTSDEFKSGSDYSLVVVKYNVGNKIGSFDCHIDRITYKDGESVKDGTISLQPDVKITVVAGLGEELVTVNITEFAAGDTSISFNVDVRDHYNLMQKAGGYATATLIFEGKVIEGKRIPLGESSVTFDNLEPDKQYRVRIMGTYDDLIGDGAYEHSIYVKTFYTSYTVKFGEFEIAKDGASFAFDWGESNSQGELTSLKVYSGDTLVKTLGVGDTSVTGLLSNTEYRLVAEYMRGEDLESISKTFTTPTVKAPSVNVKNEKITVESITAEYDITDNDCTLISYEAELYRAGELVSKSADGEISFASLADNTNYTLKISYIYDLNYGLGQIIGVFEKEIKTPPYISATECSILNTSDVAIGDTVIMQIKLDNPNDMTVKSVVINGKTYKIMSGSTQTKLLVGILCDDSFVGGDTVFSVEKINASLGGVDYSISPKDEVLAKFFVNGKLDVLRAEYVNEELEPIDWAFPSQKIYIIVTLDNSTGYTVDSLNGETNWTALDYNRIYREVELSGGWNDFAVTSISYSNENIEKSKTVSLSKVYCYEVASDEVKYISTADELKAMNEGYYYELSADIDLAGIAWLGGNFDGVFDGRGYAVQNMTFVGSVKNQNAYFGLFSSGSGIIKSVNIEGANIIAGITVDDGGEYDAYCGGIAACVGSYNGKENLKIKDCSIDENSVFNVKSGFVGGLVGYVQPYSYASIIVENCINRGSVNGNASGGLVGYADVYSNVIIENSINCGNVSYEGYYAKAGGLIGYGDAYSYATVTVENSYSLFSGNGSYNGRPCTKEQLNSKDFYTETLGWSEDIWDFSELDIDNGKYPKLK